MPRFLPVLAVLMVAPLLRAHHSTAPFDMTRGFTVTGTVAEFRWANPHSMVYLDVPAENGNSPERWTIELDAVNYLTRLGWTKQTLAVGDAFTCTGARAKNPDTYALKCFNAELADGTTLVATPSGAPSGR